MLGQQGVRYSPRNWTPVLGLPGGGVVYVSPDTGVKNIKDLVSTDAELVFGGISATGLDLLGLLTFEILGIETKAVLGYEGKGPVQRSEEHTSELQSLMRISYAVFCLK